MLRPGTYAASWPLHCVLDTTLHPGPYAASWTLRCILDPMLRPEPYTTSWTLRCILDPMLHPRPYTTSWPLCCILENPKRWKEMKGAILNPKWWIGQCTVNPKWQIFKYDINSKRQTDSRNLANFILPNTWMITEIGDKQQRPSKFWAQHWTHSAVSQYGLLPKPNVSHRVHLISTSFTMTNLILIERRSRKTCRFGNVLTPTRYRAAPPVSSTFSSVIATVGCCSRSWQ